MPGYLIADGAELDLGLVRGANTIGLTGGASAPEVLVEGVIEAREGWGRWTSRFRPAFRRMSNSGCLLNSLRRQLKQPSHSYRSRH